MTYTIHNVRTRQSIETHNDVTVAARACATLNAHNRKNGHADRYEYTPPDPPGPFELADWAKPFATDK